jgi:polar amino acid transport system permease protein
MARLTVFRRNGWAVRYQAHCEMSMYAMDFSALTEYASLFARGAAMTLGLTTISCACGIALGLAGARWSTSCGTWVRAGIASYVEVIRNTPFLIQMFVIFFGFPLLGMQISEWWAALLAMTINIAAYASEILRAGIIAVSTNQMRAGLALGLSSRQTFLHVVLPQAVAKVYPALKSQILLMMLASAVVSQISVRDLSYEANFIQGRSFRAFEVYALTAVIYLVLSFLVTRVLDRFAGQVLKGSQA